MLVKEIEMFGPIGTNLCGSVLVADWCLWIGAFQPWWIGACGLASFSCGGSVLELLLVTMNGERVSYREWRERVSYCDGEREGERERERELR